MCASAPVARPPRASSLRRRLSASPPWSAPASRVPSFCAPLRCAPGAPASRPLPAGASRPPPRGLHHALGGLSAPARGCGSVGVSASLRGRGPCRVPCAPAAPVARAGWWRRCAPCPLAATRLGSDRGKQLPDPSNLRGPDAAQTPPTGLPGGDAASSKAAWDTHFRGPAKMITHTPDAPQRARARRTSKSTPY